MCLRIKSHGENNIVTIFWWVICEVTLKLKRERSEGESIWCYGFFKEDNFMGLTMVS